MGWSKPIKRGGKTIRRDPIEGPAGFTDDSAQKTVEKADFTESVYINISEEEQKTKQAYTYVEHVDTDEVKWRLCVSGHTHLNTDTGLYSNQANSFIPGWTGDADNGWDTPTPEDKMVQISGLPDSKGVFPGNDRYPKELS